MYNLHTYKIHTHKHAKIVLAHVIYMLRHKYYPHIYTQVNIDIHTDTHTDIRRCTHTHKHNYTLN